MVNDLCAGEIVAERDCKIRIGTYWIVQIKLLGSRTAMCERCCDSARKYGELIVPKKLPVIGDPVRILVVGGKGVTLL